MRRAGLVVGETLELLRATRPSPGITTGELDAHRRGAHPRPAARRRRSSGYARLPGTHLRVGQRRGRARHPGRPGAGRGRRASRSTAARSSTAGTATPRSPSSSAAAAPAAPDDLALIEVTEESMWAGSPRSRLGGRCIDIGAAVEDRRRRGSPRRRLRHRRGLRRPRHRHRDAPGRRRSRTTGVRDRGPDASGRGLTLADRADGHPRQRRDPACSADDWTVVTADGSPGRPLRAHRRRHRPTGPGC